MGLQVNLKSTVLLNIMKMKSLALMHNIKKLAKFICLLELGFGTMEQLTTQW